MIVLLKYRKYAYGRGGPKMDKIKFAAACMRFFGKKDGETIQQFAGEIKQLTPTDKAEIKPMLEKELGVEIED